MKEEGFYIIMICYGIKQQQEYCLVKEHIF